MKRSAPLTTSLAALALGAGCASSTPPAGYYQGPPNPVGAGAMRPEGPARPATQAPTLATALLFLPGATERAFVQYQVVDGMALYQNDIQLGPAHLLQALYGLPRFGAGEPGRHYATATSSQSNRWPNREMPYEIDASVTPDKRAMVDWAVAHVSSQSVLKLRPRSAADRDYVVFTETGSGYGCSSYVGRIGGPQTVKVNGCGVRGSVVHEILHAAGLYHEQGRADRDGYVTIVWSEVSPGEEGNFSISKDTQDVGAYDYGSIMHYSSHAFSRYGNPTIVPKDPKAVIGQREGLSVLDREALASLYGGGGSGSVPPVPPPVSPPVGPPGTPPPTTGGGFAGNYGSNRGDVSCGESGIFVNCSFPGGSLTCAAQGNQLDCSWFGAGNGRAAFTRQGNGDLDGTWGNFFSRDDQGPWKLTRNAGGATGGAGTTNPGITLIPGLPPIPLPTGGALPVPGGNPLPVPGAGTLPMPTGLPPIPGLPPGLLPLPAPPK